MKKLLQIVVAALIAVLTAQPALAGVTCGMMPSQAATSASKCDMPMHQMGANCPMHHRDTGSGCLQDCCRHGWPPALVQSASKARPRIGGTAFVLTLPIPASALPTAFSALTPEEIASASPPRHVLLRVFRI